MASITSMTARLRGFGREPMRSNFVDGGRGRMSAEEMLLHVANHATYHRGYIADMLYEEGLKPPTMDLPVFIREQGLEGT